jgi:hypothetical protein
MLDKSIKSPTEGLYRVSNFSDLARFVEQHPQELPDLEYKPLFNISTCKGGCSYCSIPKQRDGQDIRFALSREAVAFANKSGGWLIVGAERYDSEKGLHRLEKARCQNHYYTPEEIQDCIGKFSTPAISHTIHPYKSADGVPVFLVRVNAGTRLYGFRGPNGDEIRMRHGLESPLGRVEEIELQVQVKEQIESNRDLRENLRHSCWEVLNEALGKFGAAQVPPRDLVSSSAFGFAVGHGCGDRTTKHLLGLDSIDVVHRLPRDITYFFRAVSSLESTFHGRLDPTEAKLIAIARSRVENGVSIDSLSVRREVIDRGEDRNEKVIRHGLLREGVSYSYAFDGLVASTGDKLLDENEKDASVFNLADALIDFIPLALDVLSFYERVKAEYGTYAVSVTGYEY